MRLSTFFFLLIAGAFYGFVPCCSASCPSGPHTLYSQRATTLDPGVVKVKSPDGEKLLIAKIVYDDKAAEGVYLSFTVDVNGQSFNARLEGYTDGEVLWSPDSLAFAVTATNNCGATAFMFDVGQTGLKSVDLDRVIQKAFGKPVKCEIPVAANTGVVDWLNGSRDVLIVGEVTPCSFCECPGMYEVYEISLPEARIAAKYPQIAAKTKFWKLLGCELRDADNTCAERLQPK